jgi:hypothetical protein
MRQPPRLWSDPLLTHHDPVAADLTNNLTNSSRFGRAHKASAASGRPRWGWVGRHLPARIGRHREPLEPPLQPGAMDAHEVAAVAAMTGKSGSYDPLVQDLLAHLAQLGDRCLCGLRATASVAANVARAGELPQPGSVKARRGQTRHAGPAITASVALQLRDPVPGAGSLAPTGAPDTPHGIAGADRPSMHLAGPEPSC